MSPIFAVVSIAFANLIPSVVRSIKIVIITVSFVIWAAFICAYISSSERSVVSASCDSVSIGLGSVISIAFVFSFEKIVRDVR